MKISLLTAFLIALYEGIPWRYGSIGSSSVITSLWVGIILGDVPTALMLGATLELMFMGAQGIAGGVTIQDSKSAALVSTTLVIASGVDIGTALAVAVPVSLICAQLDTLMQTFQSIPVSLCDKAAVNGDSKSYLLRSVGVGYLIEFVVRVIPVAVLIYLGGTFAQNIADMIPEALMKGISVIGTCMPAVGIAIMLSTMGTKALLPFFFAGFFLVKFSGMTTFSAALVGAFVAYLYYIFKVQKDGNNAVEQTNDQINDEGSVTIKEQFKLYEKWLWTLLRCESWERKQGLAFCNTMIPLFQKYYKEGSDEMKEALQRHTQFFNTDAIIGSLVPGIALAMEEKKAKGENIPGETIESIKASLMGPLAGIGDPLRSGILWMVVDAVMIQFGSQGSAVGVIAMFLLYWFLCEIWGWEMFKQGYKQGTRSATKLLSSGKFQSLIPVLSVLAMFMVGALGANYVRAALAIEVSWGQLGTIPLETLLMDMAPGLVPLCVIFFAYFITKKNKNYSVTAIAVLLLALIGGMLGILA